MDKIQGLNFWIPAFAGMTKRFINVNLLVNGDDFFYLWDFFLEESFDAHLECHLCARAAGAGALETDLYGIVGVGRDELDVTAVTLQVWPYNFDYILYLLLEGLVIAIFSTATMLAHSRPP